MANPDVGKDVIPSAHFGQGAYRECILEVGRKEG